jgi:hypothetical protein
MASPLTFPTFTPRIGKAFSDPSFDGFSLELRFFGRLLS